MRATGIGLNYRQKRPIARTKLYFLITWPVATLLVILVSLNGPMSVYAADGDLDGSFSGDGKQTSDFFGNSDAINAVTIQSDGKIVGAGYAETAAGDYDFALARYNVNGSLDSNFDADGKVTTDFQGDDDLIGAVGIVTGSKILAAGGAKSGGGDYDFALARYNPDGSPDTSFSGNGRLVTDFGGSDQALAMAFQADNKVILAGATDSGSGNDFALARYNANGSLDTSFSGDGKQDTDFGSPSLAYSVVVQPDGKIVAAGYVGSGTAYDFALARYNPNGSLDTTFSFDGKVTIDFAGDDDVATSLVLQPDGKIVVGGYAKQAAENFALARLLADGTLDTTFSGNGKETTSFGGQDLIFELALQADNKIVAVGHGDAIDFALARYNSDAGLDTTFSSDGKVMLDFAGNVDIATSLVLQPDGKIVAAGGSDDDFAVARFENDPPPPPTSTPTSSATGITASTSTSTSTSTRTATPNASSTIAATSTNTAIPANTSTPLPTQTGGATMTPTACPIEFVDVPPSNTFYDNVRCMACRNILSGYACGGPGEPCNSANEPYFRPGNLVTRGQIAKIASNSAGFVEPVGGQTFEDVPPGSTFYEFIQRLTGRGVMSGYACGGAGEPCNPPSNRPYFRPNATTTRGQLSKITSNSAGFLETVSGQTFEDVPPGSTFYEFIQRLTARGVMSGYACGGPGEPCVPPGNLPYFRPGSDVTRGQTSKIIGNALLPGCDTPARSH